MRPRVLRAVLKPQAFQVSQHQDGPGCWCHPFVQLAFDERGRAMKCPEDGSQIIVCRHFYSPKARQMMRPSMFGWLVVPGPAGPTWYAVVPQEGI